MEKLVKKHASVSAALQRLNESIEFKEQHMDRQDEVLAMIGQNSMIQCFEFSYDVWWKYLRKHLLVVEGVKLELTGPSAIFKKARSINLISDDELDVCNDITADRNTTSHVYDEDLVAVIAEKIPEYYKVMHEILTRVAPQK